MPPCGDGMALLDYVTGCADLHLCGEVCLSVEGIVLGHSHSVSEPFKSSTEKVDEFRARQLIRDPGLLNMF